MIYKTQHPSEFPNCPDNHESPNDKINGIFFLRTTLLNRRLIEDNVVIGRKSVLEFTT
jgi:hypothetical protein